MEGGFPIIYMWATIFYPSRVLTFIIIVIIIIKVFWALVLYVVPYMEGLATRGMYTIFSNSGYFNA